MLSPHPPLTLMEVSKSFGVVTLFRNVSFSVPENSIVCILGRSGSGKSTLLKIIAGLLRPDHGRVLIDNHDVTNAQPQERDVGFVFQETNSLYPHLTVRENILFPITYGKRRPRNGDAKGTLGALLHRLQIDTIADRSIQKLSGGQLQRVAIARTLLTSPRVVLLDEPLNSLDNVLRYELLDLLHSFHEEFGGAYVYVTHDDREAAYISTHLAVLDSGYLMQFDETAKVFSQPALPDVAHLLSDWTVIRLTPRTTAWSTPLFGIDLIKVENMLITGSAAFAYRISSTTVSAAGVGSGTTTTRSNISISGVVERIWPWSGRWRARVMAEGCILQGECANPLEVGEAVILKIPKVACSLWAEDVAISVT